MATKLLDPKILSKIGRLDLKAKYVVEGFISGMHRSPFHGFSVEFAQHRGYVPGDDLKHLDWRVYGKSGRYYIKQYEAETNLVCTVLLDGSESMAYGSPRANDRLTKLEYGKLITAALAYLVLGQSDAIAVGVFDETLKSWIERSTRKVHLNRICATLDSIEPEKKTGVGAILHTIAERVRRRGIIVLISDLFDSVENLLEGIQHLRHAGHEVVVLHVMDDDELNFPFDGLIQFKGLEVASELLCHPRQVKKAYLAEVEKFLTRIRAACQKNGVDYTLLNTSHSVDVGLSAYLASRVRMNLRGASGAVRA
ncbi:MAG: DUF58 domain-containing protein [Planctomycetes bacterium]|nr:DUF58 domain-containing protein [Planctomycetota bacterium]